MSQETNSKTVLQFTTRAFLIVVVLMSVGLAVVVPFVRSQPSAFAKILIWAAVISVAIALTGLLVLCLRRWRIETRGGAILLRPKRLKSWLEFLPTIIMVVVFSSILVMACATLIPGMKEISRIGKDFRLNALNVGVSVSVIAPAMLAMVYAITLIWWQVSPMTLEIREHGIGIGGLKFFEWRAIDECKWSEGRQVAIFTLSSGSRKTVALVPLDAWEPAQQLLESKGITLQRGLRGA